MRNIYASQLSGLLTSLAIFFFLFSGCAPVQMQKVTARSADYYKYTSQTAGLKISVDPYKEKDRLQDYFGCDMVARRILPVLVVIENVDAEDGYILLQDKSQLVLKGADAKSLQDNFSQEAKKAVGTETQVKTISVVGVIAPIVVIAALPAILAVEKRSKDEFAIRRNVEQNQLMDKTLYHKTSNSGFLYFQMNDKEELDRVAGVSLNLQNIRSKQVISFVINFL